MDQEFRIKAELAQGVLDYLKFRPYQEVAHLIAELVKLQPADKSEDPATVKKEDR